MPKPQPSRSAARPSSPANRPRHRSAGEETYHGLRACEALFARRPDEIVRVYLTAARKPKLAKLLRWCAERRRGFQIVEEDNLRRISGSTHHEGVAILAKAVRRWGFDDLLKEIETGRDTGPVLYLDGVENPHNLGSILRTAAHFGVRAVAGRAGELPPLSPAAVRVAEGAAELVPVCDLADPPAALRRLAAVGFAIVAASSHRGEPPDRAPLGGKCVIVLGSEGKGVSPAIDRIAKAHVRIGGTGAVESLNVSVACGILLAESWRQRPGPATAPAPALRGARAGLGSGP
ncbi:MAG: TrmH family RNA methyltransferase [Planctomycetota bacterium]